jgi:hypothetical protein
MPYPVDFGGIFFYIANLLIIMLNSLCELIF